MVKHLYTTICTLTFFLLLAPIPVLYAYDIYEAKYEPFYHGVASGDPSNSSVILWTRVTDPNGSASVPVQWQVATDTLFQDMIAIGNVDAVPANDYTVKIDIGNLQPYTYYYYRFFALGKYSLVGRTKTAPTSGVNHLRFAVVSCSNYEAGYFNAYRAIADRNDIDAILHLGDYIYEYGNGEFGNNRPSLPANEILSLNDYRIRHGQYKLDNDLRLLHKDYPFITVWDDHETANNSWRDGADNHDPATEGNWADRKSAGVQAYYEWMPMRPPTDHLLYRKISYGNLAEFFMLDTRIQDRDEQESATSPNLNDPSRKLLGPVQFSWLTNGLSNSTAQWKILGQQVMIAPLKAFGIPLNTDQWDGYPVERQNLLNYLVNNNIQNTVVLTGDIHTSWANDVPYTTYNPFNGQGSATVEFVVTSITSANFPFPVGENIIKLANTHIKYDKLTEHGYLILDITPARVQGEWHYVSDIATPNFTTYFEKAYKVNAGSRNLQESTSPVSLPAISQPFSPERPQVTLRAKLFLEGCFDAASQTMQADLRSEDLIPLTQPFGGSPWNYNGLERFSDLAEMPANAVDWVLLEARDSVNSEIVLERRAALLLDNGLLLDPDGVTNGVNFYKLSRNSIYHLSVRTRHHLAIISAQPFDFTNTVLYDLSQPANVSGGSAQLADVSGNGTVFALKSGDFNGDGLITVTDFNIYLSQSSYLHGYYVSDADLNRHITVADFNLHQANSGSIAMPEVVE